MAVGREDGRMLFGMIGRREWRMRMNDRVSGLCGQRGRRDDELESVHQNKNPELESICT